MNFFQSQSVVPMCHVPRKEILISKVVFRFYFNNLINDVFAFL